MEYKCGDLMLMMSVPVLIQTTYGNASLATKPKNTLKVSFEFQFRIKDKTRLNIILFYDARNNFEHLGIIRSPKNP